MSTIELLEPRVAPAAVVTYTDIDGDIVRITASKGPLDAGDLAFVGGGNSGQLATLNLTDAAFDGANITFSVTKAAGGNGLADVGRINAGTNDLGSIVVKGDLGVIDAGSGNATGFAIKSLSVRSMGIYGVATQGGGGDLQSDINGALGALRVQGDVKDATLSASGGAFATIGQITIGGSLIGGANGGSGAIRSEGDIGTVKIGHDLQGGAGIASGAITSGGKLARLIIGGSIVGGPENASGAVFSNSDMGAIKIGHNILGSMGLGSGSIASSGKLMSVTIGGSIFGDAGFNSGTISSDADMGKVKIGHDLTGVDDVSGRIISSGKLAGAMIGGSLIGGLISSSSDLGTVKIDGSLTGGLIVTVGNLGAVKIGGDLKGGSISGTQATLTESGSILSAHRIASVTIGGSIISGIDTSTGGSLTLNASIRAFDDIGAITVKGSIIGNVNPNGDSPVIISARGQAAPTGTSDIAIGKINIGGRVEHALILAGYNGSVNAGDTAAAALNGNAQIGSVTVGGDWLASSIAAGVVDTGNDGFGNADDTVIGGGASIAKIASILIRGVVAGTATSGDHFGFVSHQIGAFTSLGFRAPLTAGTDIIELSPITGDVTVREV
ncbi:beta strand repeat-containing protein [Verrucomicrobiota bacterium sgz303538]